MVAPSFQSYKMIVAEPFLQNGKLYVTVEHPNTKNHRNVRWYTEAEYNKQYRKSTPNNRKENGGFAGLEVARGFSQGPILLIRNNKATDEEWLERSNARYATDVGWYIVSTELPPADFPKNLKLVSLTWEEFSQDATHAKTPSEIAKIIRQKEKNNEYITLSE